MTTLFSQIVFFLKFIQRVKSIDYLGSTIEDAQFLPSCALHIVV